MPPTVNVEIEVWCSCGEGLCNQSQGKNSGIVVEPCEVCMDIAREEGREEAEKE